MELELADGEMTMVVLLSARKRPETEWACDFAAAMGLPIGVYPWWGHLPQEPLVSELQELERQRIQAAIPGATILDSVLKPGFVVVGNTFARKMIAWRKRSGVNLLAVHDECRFDPWGKKKILVPFGREQTALKALLRALRIAKKTDSSVALYHTTRPNEKCTSSNWRDHMVEGARETLASATAMCRQAGVSCEADITSVFPRSISDGVADAAFDHDCNLIVMAVASDVVFGSHALQILDRSPVPTLVAA